MLKPGRYITLGLALPLGFGLYSCQSNQEQKPPNIIMFLVDDMGWQDTSVPFWNDTTDLNRRYKTPNMERLAKQGVKFTQAYACAVSSPTRVSLMTGMNAAHHRVTNWTLRRNHSAVDRHPDLDFPEWNVNGLAQTDTVERTVYATTLPQILNKNGYQTIHCGKAHFGAISTPGANPLNLGFDVNIAGHAAGAPGHYHGTENYGNDENGKPKSSWSVPGLEKYHGTNINLTEALTLEAIHAIDSARIAKKPFYLYLAHYGVHTPIQPDLKYYQNYLDAGIDTIEAKYASMIESMDSSLGMLMDYLEQNDQNENTIIMFMSDNGGLSAVARGGKKHTHNLPLSSGKGSAHEGGIREPMLVKWPGNTQGNTQCDYNLIIEDFYPTILEMAGIDSYETVQTIDGKSFTDLLKNTRLNKKERPLFWHYPNDWGPKGPGIGASSTIIDGDWKLIYYHATQDFELFNLKDDIGEQNNLQDSNPEKLKELADTLSHYLKSVDAQMPFIKSSDKKVPWPDEVY